MQLDDKTQAVTVLAKGTVVNHYRTIAKIAGGPRPIGQLLTTPAARDNFGCPSD